MYDTMDTPPKHSYVCTNARFVKYDKAPKHGAYDFKDQFYITNLQVGKRRKAVFLISCSFSFNHSVQMVPILVHQIIVHHFLQVEYGWV
jgi:hypothetical protein